VNVQQNLYSPHFSVVIPLHNKEKSIGACLTSVLRQNFRDFEVIVIDDGSTDGSAMVAAAIKDPRLKLISRENRGVSATRNEGIQHSSAEFVAFLDADDEWLPRFLEDVSRLIQAHPDAGVYTTAIAVDKGWGRYRLGVRGVPSHPWSGIVPDYYATTNCLTSSSIVIRRSLLQRAGHFNTTMRTGEDLDMWFRLAAYAKVAYTTDMQAVWHWAGEDHASKHAPHVVPSCIYTSLATLLADETLGDEVKAAATRYAARFALHEATVLAKRGYRREARVALNDWRRRNGITPYWLSVRLLAEVPGPVSRYFLNAKLLASRAVMSVRLQFSPTRKVRT
jgi:glycosyltransferase involved in cell wall biosynthesis